MLSVPASGTKAALMGADVKARCGGFEAAEIPGVPASAVSVQGQDITPISRGCDYRAGDKKVIFSIATLQPVGRQVSVQHDDVEGMEAHSSSPGYAVTIEARRREPGSTRR